MGLRRPGLAMPGALLGVLGLGTFLVNDLYPEILQTEKEYWPAHYEAGMHAAFTVG